MHSETPEPKPELETDMDTIDSLLEALNPERNAALIEQATVYINYEHDNRMFKKTFTGMDHDLVEKRAETEYTNTDKYASPSISRLHTRTGIFNGKSQVYYECIVKWYSVD